MAKIAFWIGNGDSVGPINSIKKDVGSLSFGGFMAIWPTVYAAVVAPWWPMRA
jgi:hypothetical protein